MKFPSLLSKLNKDGTPIDAQKAPVICDMGAALEKLEPFVSRYGNGEHPIDIADDAYALGKEIATELEAGLASAAWPSMDEAFSQFIVATQAHEKLVCMDLDSVNEYRTGFWTMFFAFKRGVEKELKLRAPRPAG